MCFEQELLSKELSAMEERINKRIDDKVHQTSPATITLFNSLRAEMLDETKKITEKLDEMTPLVELVRTLNSLNKFVKWSGLTFAAIMTFFWYALKR